MTADPGGAVLVNRIEDGPVATVYSGQHNGVPVALKVFPKRFDKRTMSAFTKEQQRLATVRRVTSILMVDGVTESPSGEPALRMELCTQSLAGLVERVGPLAASDVVVLGRAVALALAAAHSAGVVHGGVSPNNVLFRATGEPVVGDFGVTLRHAFTRDPLHAIEYLPPETLREGTLNEATDLYGLGAVLHFALSARSPHPGRLGEQPGERVLRILSEPIPALNRPDVPVQLSTVVARLLATAADRRPPNAAQVADQLTALLPNPPKPPAKEDWDDFAAPAPLPPPPAAPPGQPPPPDDFDDFAPQHRKPLPGLPPPPPARPPQAPPAPTTPLPAAQPATDPQPVRATQHREPTPEPSTQVEPDASAAPRPLPLASLAPAQSEHDGVLRPDTAPTELLPTPATVEFAAQRRPGVVVTRPDFDDDFADFADPVRPRGPAKVLAGPLAPPDRAPKRMIRYDLLAGAALVLALLALVPLLLLRGDPEEMSSSPQLPSAAPPDAGGVTIELAEPVDLTSEVQLTWTANRDLYFGVVVAEEGKEAEVLSVERKHSMTVEVEPGVRYCFQVRGTDGGEDIYESEPVGLRGATCGT